MARIYYNLIIKGQKTLEEVPAALRGQVAALLEVRGA